MVLAARWAAAVVVLAVGSVVAVFKMLLAMAVYAAVMDILVAAPRLVGVLWSTIR